MITITTKDPHTAEQIKQYEEALRSGNYSVRCSSPVMELKPIGGTRDFVYDDKKAKCDINFSSSQFGVLKALSTLSNTRYYEPNLGLWISATECWCVYDTVIEKLLLNAFESWVVEEKNGKHTRQSLPVRQWEREKKEDGGGIIRLKIIPSILYKFMQAYEYKYGEVTLDERHIRIDA